MPIVAQCHGQAHGHWELLGVLRQAVLLCTSEVEVSFRELLLVFREFLFTSSKGLGVP